jgi:Helicase HerA, central domain/TraM recognition site of TraD and TraG
MKKEDFLKHTYIVGGSGSGKSELIKTIQNFIGSNTVVIDPHGDLAREIGKTAHNIEPRKQRFVINPFDIDDKSQHSREIGAQEITDLLREMIRDVGLSSLMETIAFPVIYTLLKLPYSDFKMFADCMNPNKGKARLRALRPYVEPIHADIWDELEGDTYDTSKQSLFNRLQGFLNKRAILQTVCGLDDFKAHFDLEQGVRGGNLVLNLSGLGSDVSETLGRLFMTRMQIWAKNRESIPENKRTPVFLIVDEFQNFIGEHIAHTLEEYGRKYRLFVTLAHQHVGQITPQLRGSIMANMKNKIAGLSDMATRQKVAQEMGVKAEDLEHLKTGTFCGKFGHNLAITFYASQVKYKEREDRIYCASSNGEEIRDGWDGLDVEHDTHTSGTTRKRRPGQSNKEERPEPPNGVYIPKYDI